MRRRGVLAGLTMILAVGSYVTSLLLDFNFVSPYATLEEDLSYLFTHQQNLQISVWAWLGTSVITFLSIPPFLQLFHKRMKFFHYVIAFCLLGAALGFLWMGKAGIHLYQELGDGMQTAMEETDEQIWIRLLGLFQEEQFYRRIGSSFVGLFAIGLALTRFKIKGVPLLAAALMILCGPAMIYFNWSDPDHVIRTAAMAGIMIGVSTFSVRIINRGL
ncbi:MAG: hypothetical protein P1P86_07285 [Bacteroidales bacterium]|nr:hypothetical protein [Bacteroidales bacterium]